MNQNMVGVYYTEEELYCLGINIIECLLNAKYKDKNYGIDFMNYFYSMQAFLEDVFDEINIKIINGINELFACIKSGSMNISMSNLNLLQKLENTLRDYLLYTLISSNNKDSLCDCYFHYLPHRQIFINFGLLRTYLLMLKNIRKNMSYDKSNKYNNNITEKKKEIIIGNIFDDLMNELSKYQIVFPIRMFLYKSYVIQSIFVVLHKFVRLFDKYILDANPDKFIFYNNISMIKEMTESVNNLFFLLGNDILKCLKYPLDNKKNKIDLNPQILNPLNVPLLRVMVEAHVMDYITIAQEKVPNSPRYFAHTKKFKHEMPSMSSSILNKMNTAYKKNENFNLFGNSQIFNSNQKQKNTIRSGIFNGNCNGNMDIVDSDDDAETGNNFSSKNGNKNAYTILPSNIFKSNIIRSEVKNRYKIKLSEFLYRYDITDFISSIPKESLDQLKEIGYEYKAENNKHYIYINHEEIVDPNICQIIYIGKEKTRGISLRNANMYNLIKNDPLTKEINEQLYSNFLDGIDNTNRGKNIKITLRYYDIRYNLDYFNFIEKCKKLIL